MQGETEAARSLKTRDGLGENLRGGGDLEREKCRLAPVTPEGAENSGEQDRAQDESSWEDKQAEGEIPREEEHQEGHGACRRLTRGGDKSERTCWKERTLGETAGNGVIDTVSREGQVSGRERSAKASPTIQRGEIPEGAKPTSALCLNRRSKRTGDKKRWEGKNPESGCTRRGKPGESMDRGKALEGKRTLGAAALNMQVQARNTRGTNPGEERNLRRG